jgi:prophage regulatory protein
MRHSQRSEAAIEPQVQGEPAAAANSIAARDGARILRLKQVSTIVGLAKSSIYRKVREGTFPAPIKLGSDWASGWISTEVYDWIDDQIRRCRSSINGSSVSGVGRD